jgi:hypothetical protein
MLDASATGWLAIPILFCTIAYEDPGSASARSARHRGFVYSYANRSRGYVSAPSW